MYFNFPWDAEWRYIITGSPGYVHGVNGSRPAEETNLCRGAEWGTDLGPNGSVRGLLDDPFVLEPALESADGVVAAPTGLEVRRSQVLELDAPQAAEVHLVRQDQLDDPVDLLFRKILGKLATLRVTHSFSQLGLLVRPAKMREPYYTTYV